MAARKPIKDLSREMTSVGAISWKDPSSVRKLRAITSQVRRSRAAWLALPAPPVEAKVAREEYVRTRRLMTVTFDETLRYLGVIGRIRANPKASSMAALDRADKRFHTKMPVGAKAFDAMSAKYCPKSGCHVLK